jgi:hypothetical protein
VEKEALEHYNRPVSAALQALPAPSRTLPDDYWTGLGSRIDGMANLTDGWDSYRAQVPNVIARQKAKDYLAELCEQNTRPTRVAPSVVGGIGITHRKGNRKVYVEFNNKGSVLALYSDGQMKPQVVSVETTPAGYRALMLRIKEYLDA